LGAIEKKRFEVLDFVSEEDIGDGRDGLDSFFPAQVCEKIRAKVKR
jgi:hypothetical protein